MSGKNTKILDGAYEVVGLVPGPVGYKNGVVDLSKITATEADELITMGFPYLKKVKVKAPRKSAKEE